MKEMYVISKPLYLYSDSNYFFGNLQNKRSISQEELYNSFPDSDVIRAYINEEEAIEAVRKERNLSLVEDRNHIIGVDYHSRTTPIIYKVALRQAIVIRGSVNNIHFDQIDKKIPVEVKCIEKGFDDFIPKSFTLTIKQFPSSYEKIFSSGFGDLRNQNDLKHSGLISIFGDYCGHKIYWLKGWEKLDLIMHGHWNRHHVDTVQSVMNKYDPAGLNVGDDVPGFLNDLKLKLIEAGEEINPKGSLARRIAYVQGKIGQDIIDINEINDEILAKPSFSNS
ncbi:MAG: DUF5617 domain-containing protein [Tatlockia sp.]|nr:DUF5617 domain-containing protein [Tatlockia sp.]